MATSAILGLGTRFYDSPDGTTYTERVDLVSIEGPADPEVDQIEISPVNPPSGNFKEFLNGMVEGGTHGFVQHYSAARFTALDAMLGTKKWYRLVAPDIVSTAGSKWEWTANVTKVKAMGFENKTPIGIEVKTKILSKPVFTAAT